MEGIGIVGGGAAGMGAAYSLVKAGHSVALFEAAPRLGGHCLGSEVSCPDGRSVWVDVGVSDFNRATFTNLGALFDELELEYRPIGQDASFMLADGRTVWSLKGGEARFRMPPENEDSLLAEIARFKVDCVEVLDDPTFRDWTLERYCDDRRYSDEFRRLYLYPRAQGSFPMPDRPAAQYSVCGLVAFWRIHGVAGPGPADRMVLVDGMHSYAPILADWLTQRGSTVRTSTRGVGIARRVAGVRLRVLDSEGRPETHELEHVVLAVRSNHVLPLLEDATEEEKRAFAGFQWQRASVAVHQDTTLMPDDRDAWGAYNYLVEGESAPAIRPTITFYPNLLAGLGDAVPDTFVTMNPHRPPAADKVISEHFFVHPAVAASTAAARARVDQLQGKQSTWFCGSYLTQPWVHEQAFSSGLGLAERLSKRRSGSGRLHGAAEDFLRAVPLFAGLDTSVLADVELISRSFSAAAADVLFRQNDPADGMYLIESGRVRIESRTLADETAAITHVEPGSVFGELSLLDGKNRSASAVAEVPTRGYFVSRRRFESLKGDFRPAAFDVMDRIGTEVSGYLRRVLGDIARECDGTGSKPVPRSSDPWPENAAVAALEAEVPLSGLPILSGLDRLDLGHLLAMAERVDLVKGHLLAAEGERPERLAVVVRGALRSFVAIPGGTEQVGVYGPGRAVGAASLLDGEGLAAGVEACESVVLLCLDRRAFETLRKGYSELAFKLFAEIHQGLAADLRRLTRHLARLRATSRINRRGAAHV